MIAKKFKFVNNILMFIIKLLLTNFIEKKTHRHIAKSTGMNAIILLFLRERTNGKQFGCGHTPKFLLGRRPAKMLVGEPPQTRLFGTKCPKEVGCVTAAVAPVPYYDWPKYKSGRFYIYKIVRPTKFKIIIVCAYIFLLPIPTGNRHIHHFP